jgi:hypothetical protein
MSGPIFEQLRIPAALVLIIVAAFIFLPRGSGDDPSDASAVAGDASPTAGEPGGAVLDTPTATVARETPVPTLTPVPTPKPTATPVAIDTFAAEVLACSSISGSRCDRQLDVLPSRASTFTALVLFTDAVAGDLISVILAGPGGTIAGGPFTLQGGGDGYYYSTFTVAGLPTGEYTVTATRNGTEVAQTSFRRGR